MAEEANTETAVRPEFPTGRIKKIAKLDKDINKVTSEALFLVSCSTELFLRLLAEKSAEVAIEKKRKSVRLEYLRIAVKRHQPTSDFLLDSLPLPAPTQPSVVHHVVDKPPPARNHRIEHFFAKSPNEDLVQINDS